MAIISQRPINERNSNPSAPGYAGRHTIGLTDTNGLTLDGNAVTALAVYGDDNGYVTVTTSAGAFVLPAADVARIAFSGGKAPGLSWQGYALATIGAGGLAAALTTSARSLDN